MENAFTTATIWLALAVLSTILASHLRISMALVEICIGVVAAAVVARFFGPDALGSNLEWLKFIASSGAVLLTFLAGAELEPSVMRTKIKEVTVVGLLG
ncbi:MAG: cation:proton antiporter, partial [Pseudomonadota bacterium]